MQTRKGNMCVRKNYIKDGDYPLMIRRWERFEQHEISTPKLYLTA